MADVVDGGTQNVTLYNEDGLQVAPAALATEATLAAVRAEQVRRTDTLVTTTGVAVGATQQDRVFLSSTGRMVLAGGITGGGTMRVVITNTSTTIPMLLLRVGGFSTAVGWLQMILNPTTNLPTSAARPVMNARTAATATTPLQIKVDTNTTALGGVDTGIVLGLPPNIRINVDLPPFRLDPGQSLGFVVPFPGAAEASMSIYWQHAA